MTRNRCAELMPTLDRLRRLPEQPPVIVVDNGSDDGTPDAVRDRFPTVTVIALDHNAGVAARNLAVHRVATPYVAFNDDDSWWAAGSLRRAVQLLDRHPEIGAMTAHVRVEPDGRDDPISHEMRSSPVSGDERLPGVPVLGFLACATVVRREAFLAVGGFEERLHFAGEEELLATDLAAAGWEIRYMPDLIVHHHPSRSRDHAWRRRRGVRNSLWYLWLRRPAVHAARRSWRLLRATDLRTGAGGLLEALGGLHWVVRKRRVVPAPLERNLRLLEPRQDTSSARQYIA